MIKKWPTFRATLKLKLFLTGKEDPPPLLIYTKNVPIWIWFKCLPQGCKIRLNTLDAFQSGGMIVLYLCAQLAVLYTYNCLLIMIHYRLGQNLLIINKYAVRSRYRSWLVHSIVTSYSYCSIIWTGLKGLPHISAVL